MQEKVLFYEGKRYFLSNFSSFAILQDGVIWMTVEHAYQAAKFTDPAIVEEIRTAMSAHDSKKIGRKYQDKVRADWNDIKLDIMEKFLRMKIEQHAYVREKLLETGNAELVEDSPKDSFWGRGPDWQGLNHLGKLWMKLRGELRERGWEVLVSA